MRSDCLSQGRVLVLASLLVIVTACGKVDNDAAALDASKIDMVAAIEAAQQSLSDGFPVEVEMLMLEDTPHYLVEVMVGDDLSVVHVNGLTGAITETSSTEPSDKEKATLKSLSKIDPDKRVSLLSAVKRAMKDKPEARPVEVDVRMKEDKVQFDIRLLAGTALERVKVGVLRAKEVRKQDGTEGKNKDGEPAADGTKTEGSSDG